MSLLASPPYSKQELVKMMEECLAYKGSTAEAYEEFKEMCQFENWNDLTVFKDKACVFYEGTPALFHGLVLLYISICFKLNDHNQNTSGAILFALYDTNSRQLLTDFTESELEILHRWIGWLVSRNEYRFDYSPIEMLQIYTTLLTAQAAGMLANVASSQEK